MSSTPSLSQLPLHAPAPAAAVVRFSGPVEFSQRIRDAAAQAAAQRWPLMIWADADFCDWPLCERGVVDALDQWAGKGRLLRILATRFDAFARLHPRFVTWRQRWDHVIDCRVCDTHAGLTLPSVWWTPKVVVQRLDVERSLGWAGEDPWRLVQLRSELDECEKHSVVGFPSTTLGL